MRTIINSTSVIRIVLNIMLFVSENLNLFRISIFEFVLNFQPNNVVSRNRTMKAFEVELAN